MSYELFKKIIDSLLNENFNKNQFNDITVPEL